MNRQQFIDIIENPVAAKEQNLSVVKELLESFPYYAAPYVVLSRIFYDDNSIYFDKYLKLSAVYVGDRELLYEYINSKSGEETERERERERESEPERVLIEKEAKAEKAESASELTIDTETEREREETGKGEGEAGKGEAAVIGTEQEKASGKEEEITAQPLKTMELAVAEAPTPDNDAVKNEPVAELPAESVLEISEDNPSTPAAGENTDTKPVKSRRTFQAGSADPLALASMASFDYFAYQERLNRQAAEEIKPDVRQQKKSEEIQPAAPEENDNKAYSFTEWMQRLKQQPIAKQEVVPTVNKEEKTSSPAVKKQLDDIIDTFIRTEPRIKPKAAKIFNPENMAQQSAEEDFSLATETLANIYLRQGLEEKAIEIFRQLILKFPEKNSYFAGKIEAIKNKEK